MLKRILLVLSMFSAVLTVLPDSASAIPAFSRRYETSCNTCHQYHYPRLNSFGRTFRENGYQWPEGAEDPYRASRSIQPADGQGLAIFKEVPLSLRGQAFGLARPVTEDELEPNFDVSIFSFVLGGGSVTEDVSYFFSWTPFPDPSVHQARVGVHNLAANAIGKGTLNVRAGALFLLDFQRPGHRFLSAAPTSATEVAVGLNRFTWDETSYGVQLYGRPLFGPFMYELAVVAGDPGDEGFERDAWKDGFARLSYTFFQNTSHELRLGGFGYLGRSDIVTDVGGVELAIRDDFYMVGGDLELDVGPLNLFAMSYYGHHGDPLPDGLPVSFVAVRAEALWSLAQSWALGLRGELVRSEDLTSLDRAEVSPHLTFLIATNALASLVWRQSLDDVDEMSGLLVLDVAF